MRIPSWDCLPYDRIGPSPGVAAARMAALSRLAHRKASDVAPLMVIATVPAMLQRVPPKAAIAKASFMAQTGHDVAVADLERYLRRQMAMCGPPPFRSGASSPSGAE